MTFPYFQTFITLRICCDARVPLSSRRLFFSPPHSPRLPLSHLSHYSAAYARRVIVQIIQRQLSVCVYVCVSMCDTGEWSHHHKQPLMALSGSSRMARQLGPKRRWWWRQWRRLRGAKCCGHYSVATAAKNFYPNEFGPCQVIAKRQPRGHPIPS